MALRVLLADESSTIKKVFQLALQDFAVEVRPVNIGVDVLPVAQNFAPDIVFVDILLQKKNGYDVSAELKQDSALKGVPIVLMWSGFMELDEDKYQASRANAQLEKPFDVAALRKLVTDLVPRTKNQRISKFLTFPDAPTEEILEKPPQPVETASEPEEDFTQVPISKMKSSGAPTDKFRVDLQPEELEPEHIPVRYEVPDEEPEEFSLSVTKSTAMNKVVPPPPPPVTPQLEEEDDDELVVMDEVTKLKPTVAALAAPALSEKELERIIRSQSAEVIEAVVWKIVPEIATQIIERELNKLLKEREPHPY